MFSTEGNMVINEGSISNYVEDYHYMELAVINTSDKHFDTYTIFDHPLLKRDKILQHNNFEYEIEVIKYIDNCELIRRNEPAEVQYRGMMKNFIINELMPLKEENMKQNGRRQTCH